MKHYKLLLLYCLSFCTIQIVASEFPLGSSYSIDATWTKGYAVTVTLDNNTFNTTTSWEATFSLGTGQKMTNPWGATVTINGPTITVTNPGWEGGETVPVNGTTTFGFIVDNPQATTPGLTGLDATANGGGGTTKLLESYWESWDSAPIANIVAMDFNIVNVSFATFSVIDGPSNTFAIVGLDCDQPTLTSFITQAHNAGKIVKISIGGATYPMTPFLTSDAKAQGMANAIADFVVANDLDGVDFDIEDHNQALDWGTLQVALIQYTRAALGPNAILSYAPQTPTSTTYSFSAVSQGAHPYLDVINIQAYNDCYPEYNYQDDINGMVNNLGIPITKIGVGLMPGPDDCPVPVETTLANITTAANYIIANNLVGMMQWSLNRDYDNRTGLGAGAATTTAWDIFNP